jgi:hypothetical protein
MSAPQQLTEQQRNRLQTAHRSLPRRRWFAIGCCRRMTSAASMKSAGSTIGLGCRAALLTAVPGLAAEGAGRSRPATSWRSWPSRSMPIPARRADSAGASITLTGTYHWKGRQDSVGPVQTSPPRRRRALQGNGSLAWYFCQSVGSGPAGVACKFLTIPAARPSCEAPSAAGRHEAGSIPEI